MDADHGDRADEPLDAAGEKAQLPARSELEADVARYEMAPLFIPGVSDTI